MTITGFTGIYKNGDAAKIDAHGNNVAFLCNKCGHPVLAIAREHQRGSSINKPATCLGCGEDFIIEAKEVTKNVLIYGASEYSRKINSG
jgi:transcription elongation factor Elf1